MSLLPSRGCGLGPRGGPSSIQPTGREPSTSISKGISFSKGTCPYHMGAVSLLLIGVLLVLIGTEVAATRKTPGGGKVPLGVSRASVKKSLANKHLAGPTVALNPRQEEVEKKLQKAKKRLQQIDKTVKNGDSGDKYQVNSKEKNEKIAESVEPATESKRTIKLKDLLKIKRSLEK